MIYGAVNIVICGFDTYGQTTASHTAAIQMEFFDAHVQPEMVRPVQNIASNLVPCVIFWSHPSNPLWYKVYMSSESESEDDLLQQATMEGYPEGCT